MKNWGRITLVMFAFTVGLVFAYSCGGGSSAFAGGDADTLDGLDSTDFALSSHTHTGPVLEYGTTFSEGCADRSPSPPDLGTCSNNQILSTPTATSNWAMAAQYTVPGDGVVEVLARPAILYDNAKVPSFEILLELTARNATAGTPGAPDPSDLIIGSTTIVESNTGSAWTISSGNTVLSGRFDTNTSQGLISAGDTVNVFIRASVISGFETEYGAFYTGPVSIRFRETEGSAVTIDP